MLLFAADRATETVVEEAKTGAFDLVLAESGVVIIGGEVLLDATRTTSTRDSHPHRVSWQRLAVQRVLALTDKPLTQLDIADRTGATQQAVSRAVQSLEHVLRTRDGWIGDSALMDQWLADYPSPRGTQTHWYGLGPPASQLRSARTLLTELTVGSVVTGELAADRYAPWMLPNAVRLYVDEIIDFTDVGLSPADPADATITVVVPEDPTIRTVAAHYTAHNDGLAQPVPADAHLFADPAIVLWDLYNTSTDPTAGEAADRLREVLGLNRAE